MKLGNQTAFPARTFPSNTGLSKREYIATQCLAGLLGDPDKIGTYPEIAVQAVECADALLAELAKDAK